MPRPVQDRSPSDANFDSAIALLAPCIAWIESLPDDHQIGPDDRNMMGIPAEIALAFVREGAKREDGHGPACRAALALLEQFRRAEGSREPEAGEDGEPQLDLR